MTTFNTYDMVIELKALPREDFEWHDRYVIESSYIIMHGGRLLSEEKRTIIHRLYKEYTTK